MAEEFFIRRSKAEQRINGVAIAAWLLGGGASYIALTMNFFVPPIIGIVGSGLSYLVLTKMFQR